MQSPPPVDKPAAPPPVKLDPATLLNMQVNHLAKIEDHLRVIRTIVVWFAILSVIGAVLSICSVLLTYFSLTP